MARYNKTKEAALKTSLSMPELEFNKYKTFIAGALNRIHPNVIECWTSIVITGWSQDCD
ncbi:MAG: hypothetical protein ACFFKA_06040 [Candidatus Thorarchaeota archaeon]